MLKLSIFTILLLTTALSWAEPEAVADEHWDHVTHRPHSINTDRPHVSEAPVVVGTGTFQIEAGLLSSQARPGGEPSLTSTPTLLRLGTSPETELRLEGDFLNYQSHRLGFGDTSLGLKHVLVDDGPEVAMLYIYKFASGSPRFRSAPEPEVKVLLGFELGADTELEVNLGARSTVAEELGVRFVQGTFASALTHALTPDLDVFAEIFGDGPFEPGRSGALLTAQGGFLYRLNENTQLDLEVLRGLSSSGTNWGLGVGISSRY